MPAIVGGAGGRRERAPRLAAQADEHIRVRTENIPCSLVSPYYMRKQQKADVGTPSRQLYEDGVRFGCWGMSMYSLSCACYSFVIERLIKRFGAKRVYVGGLLVYGSGMLLMAICCHRAAVLIFSWTAGVMYSTLFTMPYLLVAHYHSLDTFSETVEGAPQVGGELRGLGTDVAIVSSMVFMAQLLLSCGMGTVVSAAGSTTAVVASAAVLALCGAVAASRVMYLDL